MRSLRVASVLVVALGFLPLGGCTGDGQPTLMPNHDPALHHSSAEFAADAAKRQFEATAPQAGNAPGRAEYTLQARHFDVVNISNEDWNNVEFWVNEKYVLFVPVVPKNQEETLNFELFYDSDGHHFKTEGKGNVHSLKMFYQGKMYDVIKSLE